MSHAASASSISSSSSICAPVCRLGPLVEHRCGAVHRASSRRRDRRRHLRPGGPRDGRGTPCRPSAARARGGRRRGSASAGRRAGTRSSDRGDRWWPPRSRPGEPMPGPSAPPGPASRRRARRRRRCRAGRGRRRAGAGHGVTGLVGEPRSARTAASRWSIATSSCPERQRGQAERAVRRSEAGDGQAGHDREVGVRGSSSYASRAVGRVAEHVGRLEHREHRHQPRARVRRRLESAGADRGQRRAGLVDVVADARSEATSGERTPSHGSADVGIVARSSSSGSSSSRPALSQRIATSWAPYHPRASASPTSTPSS